MDRRLALWPKVNDVNIMIRDPGVTARGDTRREIVRAASAIFRAEGEGGLTMRRVGAAAGITAPAIYRHFAGRDELLEEMAEDGFGALSRRMERAVGKAPPSLRLERAIEVMLVFALDEPRLSDLMFASRRKGVRRFPKDFLHGESPTGRVIAREVAALMERGAWRKDDPLEVGLALGAQAQGFVALRRGGRLTGGRKAFLELWRRSYKRLKRGLEA
jgi:AcrR family transcriptional regulator